MKVIWSFWTKPHEQSHTSRWLSEKHHLLSWILSVEAAREHYPKTCLCTDDDGAKLLVDSLRLPFYQVTTDLNALASADARWWAIGKLYAYRAQTNPFVHIDSDVFLWRPLPERTAAAQVFAQNREHFTLGNGWYRPQLWEAAVGAVGGWLPEEWTWYSGRHGNEAVCCGLLGGSRTDFIAHYADAAIRMVEHSRNQTAWLLLHDRIGDNILFEQYFLAACLHYHASHPESPFTNIRVKYLFESDQAAFDPDSARRVGYTHLIGGAKRDFELARRLEVRVRRDYPLHYERLIRYLAGSRCRPEVPA